MPGTSPKTPWHRASFHPRRRSSPDSRSRGPSICAHDAHVATTANELSPMHCATTNTHAHMYTYHIHTQNTYIHNHIRPIHNHIHTYTRATTCIALSQHSTMSFLPVNTNPPSHTNKHRTRDVREGTVCTVIHWGVRQGS